MVQRKCNIFGLLVFFIVLSFMFASCSFRATSEIGAPSLQSNTLTDAEKDAGWKLLFDGMSFNGWKSPNRKSFPDSGWQIQNGALTVLGTGGGDIITEQEFSDFELYLEFKLTSGANSGIKYFVKEIPGHDVVGLEYQLLDDENHPDAANGIGGNRTLASLYDLIPADNKTVNPIGEWNHARIIVEGDHVQHWLNGKKVVEYRRSTQMYRALIQKSKYAKYDNFGMWDKGHILLQDHGDVVYFRNIKIREL
ncbi:DUF1080 domain-containing protein [candidate division KSB1 bacterium]|nr:DUF1080 domain-containing protein [candidate division KSB1 bacterium]